MVTIPMTIATSDTIVTIKNKRGRFFSRKKVPNQTDRIGKITKLMGEFLKAKKQQSKCCLVENVTTEKKNKKNKQTNKLKNIFVKRKRARWRMSQRKPQQSSPAHRFGHNTPPERFFKQTNRNKQKQIWKYDLDTSKVAKTGKQDKKTLSQPI